MNTLVGTTLRPGTRREENNFLVDLVDETGQNTYSCTFGALLYLNNIEGSTLESMSNPEIIVN